MSKIVLALCVLASLCAAQTGTPGNGTAAGTITCDPALIGVGDQYIVTCPGNPVNVSQSCVIQCAPGFTGRTVDRVCQGQDKWSGFDPQCSDKRETCTFFPCGVNATCRNLPPPALNTSDGRVCTCNVGFYGDPNIACYLNTTAPCPPGYFSNSGYAPCEQCRVCLNGAVATAPCTPTSNTECPPRTDCGWMSGDPHFGSLDGAYYDFQGAGEFYALRSINDNSVNVQTKLTPCAPGVTCVNGLSVTLGANNVSLSYVSSSFPRDLKIFQNNVDVTTSVASVPLTVNGVTFTATQTQWGATQYTINDQAKGILITVMDYYYLSVTFCVRSTWYDQIDGLMGRYDGIASNDNPALQGMSHQFLVQSGESWRVPESESTTHYAVNETYNSINDPSFVGITFGANFQPSPAAATACAGLAQPFKAACEQDVTTTNDNNFASAAAGFSAFVAQQNEQFNPTGSSAGSSLMASMLVVVLAVAAAL